MGCNPQAQHVACVNTSPAAPHNPANAAMCCHTVCQLEPPLLLLTSSVQGRPFCLSPKALHLRIFRTLQQQLRQPMRGAPVRPLTRIYQACIAFPQVTT